MKTRRVRHVARTSSLKNASRLAVEALEWRTMLSAVFWSGGGDGINWTDVNNWSGHALPAVADDVTINAAAGVAVRLASGTQSIHSLTSTNPITLIGGTLAVGTTAQLSADLTLSGGTVYGGSFTTSGSKLIITSGGGTLAGVTVNGPLDLTGGSVSAAVTGGLTLNGTATFGYDARLYFNGTQTLGGAGTVLFQNVASSDPGLQANTDGMTLTLGPGVTVRGGTNHSARVGSTYWGGGANTSVVVQGAVVADAAGGTLGLTPAGSGTLASTGTFSVAGGTLNLGGTFTRAGLGTLTRSGGTVNLTGTLSNAGSTLTLDAASGSWNLAGGTVAGGTVAESGGAGLIVTGSGGTLAGVTVNGPLDLTGGSVSAAVTGGLTLNGTATFGYDARLYFNGTQTLGGAGTVLFQNVASSDPGLQANTDGMTLTLGPGVTVRGGTNHSARVGSTYWGGGANTSVVVQGAVVADAAGGTLGLTPAGSGTLASTGTFSVAGGTLNLGGTFTRAGLGTLTRSGGTVNLTGTLSNAGSTLTLDAASGSWNLAGGTVAGGTVAESGGAGLIVTGSGGTLAGVTVNGPLDLTGGSVSAAVTGGLTLNGTATFGYDARLYFNGTQTLGGAGTVLFQNVASSDPGLQANTDGMTLTLGPGVTVRGGTNHSARVGSTYWGGGANTSVVVQGAVVADAAGGTLGLTPAGSGTLASTGTLSAQAGGTLYVSKQLTVTDQGLLTGAPTGTLQFGNNLLSTTTNPLRFNPQGAVVLTGGGTAPTPELLEAVSQDFGAVAAGFASNSAFGTLTLTNNTYARLIDTADNSAGTGPESVYAGSLVVSTGTTLDLNGLHLYARAAQINGTVVNGTVTVLADSGPLSLATPTPGAISPAGNVDEWTFFGRVGRAVTVLVNPGTSGSLAPVSPPVGWVQVQLVDAGGTVLSTGSSPTSGAVVTLANVRLPADGTYKVRVSAAAGHTAATGNYVVTAYDSTPNALTLQLNQTVTGTLGTPYAADQYGFTAVAGQQVRFRFINASTSGITYSLAGPNGYVAFTDAGADSTLITLPAAGGYTLVAHSLIGATGSYAFRVEQTAVTAVTLNALYSGSLAAGGGQAQLYQVDVPSVQVLSVTLADAATAGHTELYVRFGSPPTRETFDYAASGAGRSQSVVVPSASPGSWFILVYGESVPAASPFTLLARGAAAKITSVFPTTAGNAAAVTLTVTGAGFTRETTITLVAADGTTMYVPPSFGVDLYTQMTATFPAGLPAGTYAVRAATGTNTDTFPAAVTVTAGGTAHLETNLILPPALGRHAVATLYVEFANTGDLAMPAPLLSLQSADPDGSDKPILTLDQSRIIQNYWSSGLPPGTSNSVLILGSGKQPGVLNPGERIRIPVYYLGLQQPWDFSDTQVELQIRYWTESDATPIDWSSRQEALRPPTLSTAQWSAVYGNLTSGLATTGDYVHMLNQNASYLGKLGEQVTSVDDLWNFEVQQAFGYTAVPTLDSAVDASMPGPGVSLEFDRSYSNTIPSRFNTGTLGLGWFSPWQTTLVSQASGALIQIVGAGGSASTYQRDTRNGSYFSGTGDSSTLVAVGNGVYDLETVSGTVTRFRADGKIDSVRDTNGNKVTAGYDANGRLATLTHTSGAKLTIGYNAAGRVGTITDSAGRVTTYGYDPTNTYLMTVTTADGKVTAYTYETTGAAAVLNALLSVQRGGTTQFFTYDAHGRLATSYLTGNAQFIGYGYDDTGLVTVTDSAGTTSLYFDYNGELAKTVDPLGYLTSNTYGSDLRLARTVSPTGESQSFTWCSCGSLTSETNELGQTTTFTYDYINGSFFKRMTSFTDAAGNKTTYTYDTTGNLLTTVYPNSSVEQLSNYTATGLPGVSSNRRNQLLSYTYNAAGQVTKQTFNDNTFITYAYDTRGNLKTVTDGTKITTYTYNYAVDGDRLDRVTYPNGRYLNYTYDSFGRRKQMVDQDGYATNYEYDAAGRLYRLRDTAGNLLVTYTYDASGRLKQVDKGNGTFTTYDYDAAGQLLSLKNWQNATTLNSKFDYTYDSRGRRITMTTLDGSWTYTYDGTGQLIRAVFASLNTATIPNQDLQYFYDAVGNRTKTILNGVTTVYAANNLNEYASVGGVTQIYDADGNLTFDGVNTYTWDQQSRLVRVSGLKGVTEYEYDSAGNKVSETENGSYTSYLIDPTGGNAVASEYAGQTGNVIHCIVGIGVTGQSDQAGNQDYFDFDGVGSVVGVTGSGGSLASTKTYSPFGEIINSVGESSSIYGYVGEWGVTASPLPNVYTMNVRLYSAATGRFDQDDFLGIDGGDANIRRYAANDPTDLIDPSGYSATSGQFCTRPLEGNAHTFGILYHEQYFSGQGTNFGLLGRTSLSDPQGLVGSDENLNGYVCSGPSYNDDEMAYSRSVTQVGNYNKLPKTLFGGNNCQNYADKLRRRYNLEHDAQACFPVDPNSPTSIPDGGNTDPSSTTPVPSAVDPNSEVPGAGFGSAEWISAATSIPYQINFENDATANAPAQTVTITDQLSSNFDWSTFSLTEIGWADTLLTIPIGTQHFQTTVRETSGGKTYNVLVDVGINTLTGLVTALFQTLDPVTGLPPDVLTGFLLPEPAHLSDPVADLSVPGRGQGTGHLGYTVRPKAGLATGTEIRNVALISFDQQPTISTDQVDPHDPSKGVDPAKQARITIDAGNPTSTVAALPPVEPTTAFNVSWAGSDDANGSGVASYTVYVSTNGGPFTPWLTNTTLTTATFAGVAGYAYQFYSVAKDNVGNVQPTPTSAQATTTVYTNLHPVPLSGSVFYLKLDADGQHLDVWNGPSPTGSPSQSVAVSDISMLSVTGVASGTSLTVDFSAGDPLPTTGLTFAGVAGVANVLSVIGTAGNDAITVNGTTVTESAASGSATMTYSNLSAITFAGGTGSDTLTQAAQPGGGASLTFVSPTAADSLLVNGGRYTFPAAAAGSKIQTITLGSLSVGAGATVAVAPSNGHPNRAVLVLGGLTVGGSASNPTGRLDLADNDLVLRNGTLATVAGLARSGFAGGTWAGPGLASSAAAADSTHLTAVGVILNAATDGSPLWGAGTGLGLFDGVDTTAADVLVKYTYYGDANLDGATNAADYTRLDAGFVLHQTGWLNGDFNYDGAVDGSDYALTDNAFNAQQVPLSAISPVLTLAAVPGGLAYDGTNDVSTWAVPTLTGIAGHPAPTGTPIVRFYAGPTATGSPLAYPPVLPGTYTVVASYVGDNIYAAAATAPVTFTVARATPTLTLTPGPAVVWYDGTADVTAWAKAVLFGVTDATGPTGAAAVVFYAGTSTTGTPLSSPPVNAGTYTAVATYAGDALYLPATSAPATFVVSATAGATPLNLLAAPAYYLRLNADGQHLDVWANATGTGTPAQSVLLATTSSIGITGAAGGTIVTVDLSGGDPLVASGLTFAGVAGAANVLTVTDAGDAGNAAFAATADTVYVTAGVAALMPLTYANVSAVNVVAGSGTDTLTQLAQPGRGSTSLAFTRTTASDSLTVNAGTFTYPAAGAYVLNGLTVGAGAKVVMAAPATPATRAVLVIRNLKVATDASGAWAGTLDLAGNDLIVRGGGLATVSSLATSGFANGLWTGPGLANAAAATDARHRMALGVIQNLAADGMSPLYTSFDGQSVAATDVLVRSTYYGDLNLDGMVNAADYTRLDVGYVGHLTGWASGDVNYDGVVDGTDYTLIDNTFNTQG